MKNESNRHFGNIVASEARWLTEAQTAERLGLSRKVLQKWRLSGAILRFAKFGSAVRYAVADIEAFERESLRTRRRGRIG